MIESPSPVIRLPHAPVLLLPNIVDRSICQRLIAYWESNDKEQGAVSTSREGTDLKLDVKRREDVPLLDRDLSVIMRQAFLQRIVPAVRAAFQFEITQFETMRIGCYPAGGYFRAHRDNTTPYTCHRRFAVTLNLNTGDYEGGALRFPEFASAPFEAPAGGAVVFSCSLLHEAFPVTRGRRFGLFTFLFDDAGAAHVRQMLAAEAQRRPDFTSGAAVRRS